MSIPNETPMERRPTHPGEVLREDFMPDYDLTVTNLAEALGVSRQTINAVETDKYDPSLPLALRMARLFGVAVPDLFIDHWEPVE